MQRRLVWNDDAVLRAILALAVGLLWRASPVARILTGQAPLRRASEPQASSCDSEKAKDTETALRRFAVTTGNGLGAQLQYFWRRHPESLGDGPSASTATGTTSERSRGGDTFNSPRGELKGRARTRCPVRPQAYRRFFCASRNFPTLSSAGSLRNGRLGPHRSPTKATLLLRSVTVERHTLKNS